MDVSVLSLAFILAYLLRFDFEIPAINQARMAVQLPALVSLQFAILILFGVYSFIWRYVGMRELFVFGRAGMVALVPVLMVRFLAPGTEFAVPLSVAVIDTVLAVSGILGVRVLRRAVFEKFERDDHRPERHQRTLLVGAGRAGVLAVKELRGRASELQILGFVDDDLEKHGSVIHGVPVLGPTADLPSLVAKLRIDQVVLTIARAPGKDLRRIVRVCESIPVRTRIIPGFYEVLEGSVEVSRMRDVQIEDLLGRDPVELDQDGLGRFIGGETVLVSGAGGSIGSELCRQILRFGPKKLVLAERSEFALFTIDRELRSLSQRHDSDTKIVSVLADVTDGPRLDEVFGEHYPAIVVHAAAHKHVPLMEANVGEAVKNNIFGTDLLAHVAGRFSVKTFVLISTDKAVRPTSVMGATKRMAELVVQSKNSLYDTRYVAVRFGNVLGSAGSVIPIFREQIRNGGPVTVTHPDMVRYFMTIPEATQLVLQAGAIGDGGELFILDMGEPVRIVDLARDMIRLSGAGDEVEVQFSGVRPGEKLFEELETADESIAKTRHPKIYIGEMAKPSPEDLAKVLDDLREQVQRGDHHRLRKLLAAVTPESNLTLEEARPAPSTPKDEAPVRATPPLPLPHERPA
ncbi:MAG: nucleoside-diphosphate sugar epimerase/dehydratase [Myxococcota bacterium]